ncbi:hypothetical protein [Rhodoferax sp.]|uniref:hypothetical protein n=1 Tax=Rhodoferax sp. TaxID=50421 RepID=UPI00274EAF0D|nr:hypothetical protein [Rhodoferax sp.]
MTRHHDPSRPDWAAKVLPLIRSGNLDAALAQIKVAPSVKDLKQLQSALSAANLKPPQPVVNIAIADQIDALLGSRLHRSP